MRAALTHPNPFVRKGAATALGVPRALRRLAERCRHVLSARLNYWLTPPVLANSFPKSGTHLLYQVAQGLPDTRTYGRFLSSMTSSTRFTERSPRNVVRYIQTFVPGEIVRGHLFYAPEVSAELKAWNVVHLFIYRDPRDVVVSEAHYLREMNRWHRLSRHFRGLSIEDAITLSITGIDGTAYPDIASRFARYAGWLDDENCLAVRYEDVVFGKPLEQIAAHYARRSSGSVHLPTVVETMAAQIKPASSHTFRRGSVGRWREEFTPKHHDLFDAIWRYDVVTSS